MGLLGKIQTCHSLNTSTDGCPKFLSNKSLRVADTPPALEALTAAEIGKALGRHHPGDWGELDDQDRQTNDAALQDGGRLFSADAAADGTTFWVITESDRSATTVLLPSDY